VDRIHAFVSSKFGCFLKAFFTHKFNKQLTDSTLRLPKAWLVAKRPYRQMHFDPSIRNAFQKYLFFLK
jgi:hypothetical protein